MDDYDFSEWWTGLGPASLANNGGYVLQKVGQLAPYQINVRWDQYF